ncbi:7,8-dihydropterin-6-methyl-4-(beta-D-ribofuranosyl)-aminobenzene-5'-phosphate synthase [Candidatus Methanoplasma termitum]|uniref:7, 8-dihydropterin-6-methyl-4-(Beta-D-ribofuranosyl)-aminobenzene-5'-phosphate synthase n=1 Tax=Candidatus Methanoplasma termitum TaxID=1577791 RepID=A0A0A7LE77_9ARCH|nr:MBL fold metallo-hydrolase [Candidatus Methanoplasma termitum]AIZ57303.1 7,8-dihydropterin-6-methyl-4-(beta-D-ribofuranosyl)-aminobenzene-5'-phosphate synthase [Candidatus Methanoplasma termitum]MCL2334081.1 MBL fold metallo-hydrolase [Candidatus Methanoplasma sp.]
MEAKITSVYDEGAVEGTPLIGAEGFSVLIEIGSNKILFDTGRRGRYLMHNLSFLDIEPEMINTVVISHGHKGHAGGLDTLLRERETPLLIYAPRFAMGTKTMFGTGGGIQIGEDIADKADIVEINDWKEIADKVFVSAPMDIGKEETESFIVIRSRKGPIVISSCSHAGADKVMEAVKSKFGAYPHGYVGGLHMGKKEKTKAEAVANLFSEKNCNSLYINHCTGVNGIMYMRAVLGIKGVNNFYVGSSISVDL